MMLNDLQSGKTFVGRLRIVGASVDPILTRLRAASLLNSANFQAAAIAPSAIVFIRQLRDPMPGVLRLDQDGGYLPERWNDALAESIHKLMRNAARPAVGPVTGSEEAVIFLDRPELLACLATDLCKGAVAARWWWQTLLRNDFAEKLVKDSWKAAPEYVPAAMARLAKNGIAADFVKLWSQTESLGLLQDVIKSFALHELTPVVAFARNGDVGTAPITGTAPPAWKRWVPESDTAGLEIGQQLLLSTCLLLRRAPAIVRTSDFALEISNWYRHASATPASAIKDDRTIRDARATATSPVIAWADDKVDSAVDSLQSSADDFEKDSKVPEPSLQRSTVAHTSSQTTQPSDSVKSPASLPGVEVYVSEATKPAEVVVSLPQTQVEESNNTSLFDHQPNSLSDDGTANEESELLAAPETSPSDSVMNREQIETRFGGLFYLINLGIYLNLYGDFTSPAKPGIELNVWDFVALVGAELIGSNDDPIWPFLAHLAGREADQAPGEGFTPADSWRIEPEWLTHFSSTEPWTWSSSDDRLRLLHPEGFLVLDLPLDASDPARQLRAETEKYESVLSAPLNLKLSSAAFVNTDPKAVTRNASPEVRAWLARLMPYVRARLRAALDLRTEDELASLVCRRFARVDATETHVDVYFGLADLPLEIRLAGLDRDPGWVPAAGRFIAFHFD